MEEQSSREAAIAQGFALSRAMGVPCYVYVERVPRTYILTPDAALAREHADEMGVLCCDAGEEESRDAAVSGRGRKGWGKRGAGHSDETRVADSP